MSIKVWDEIPVKEHDRGLQLLIISEKGREGLPFSLTLFVNSSDNFAYIIQVYIMPNMLSHGIMNIT